MITMQMRTATFSLCHSPTVHAPQEATYAATQEADTAFQKAQAAGPAFDKACAAYEEARAAHAASQEADAAYQEATCADVHAKSQEGAHTAGSGFAVQGLDAAAALHITARRRFTRHNSSSDAPLAAACASPHGPSAAADSSMLPASVPHSRFLIMPHRPDAAAELLKDSSAVAAHRLHRRGLQAVLSRCSHQVNLAEILPNLIPQRDQQDAPPPPLAGVHLMITVLHLLGAPASVLESTLKCIKNMDEVAFLMHIAGLEDALIHGEVDNCILVLDGMGQGAWGRVEALGLN